MGSPFSACTPRTCSCCARAIRSRMPGLMVSFPREPPRSMNHRANAATCVSLILAALGCGGSDSVFVHRDGSADGADAPGESGSASGGGSSGAGTDERRLARRTIDGRRAVAKRLGRAGRPRQHRGRRSATPTRPRTRRRGDGAAPTTCHSCAVKNCPTQVASCGAASPCSAFLRCELACSADGGSNCSNTCDTMDPAGETAYAALTLCDLGPCGAGCVALLAAEGP